MKSLLLSSARAIAINAINIVSRIAFPGSKKFWENRYSKGGTSGYGSYGKLAEYKAEIINSFVRNNRINSVIEFGCGDGNILALCNYPRYIGLDVSKTAIKLCMKRFINDKQKSFFLYDPENFKDNISRFKADLALSLDVIYVLTEDIIYSLYMKHLFSSANKFIIIYSSNTNSRARASHIVQPAHIKHRQFSKWVETYASEWKLVKKIKNRFPNESPSDFFIYKKKTI